MRGHKAGVRIKLNNAPRSSWGSHVNSAGCSGEMAPGREGAYTRGDLPSSGPSASLHAHTHTSTQHFHPHPGWRDVAIEGKQIKSRVRKPGFDSPAPAAWLWLSHFPTPSLSFLAWKITPAPASLLLTHVR